MFLLYLEQTQTYFAVNLQSDQWYHSHTPPAVKLWTLSQAVWISVIFSLEQLHEHNTFTVFEK